MASVLSTSCAHVLVGDFCGTRLPGGGGRIVAARADVRGGARCQLQDETAVEAVVSSRRAALAALAAIAPAGALLSPAWAILEADDDDELLAKVKQDRQTKIDRRNSRGMYKAEAASVQKGVYTLSKAGKALDESDITAASSALGADSSAHWVVELNGAISKVSSSKEEQTVAKDFSSALGSLQAAVSKQDTEGAKKLFVSTAGSLEKWARLTGLSDELLGL